MKRLNIVLASFWSVRLLGAVAVVLLCSSCESVVPWGQVSTLPPEIPFGKSMRRVRWDRGLPQRQSEWYAATSIPPTKMDPCFSQTLAKNPPARFGVKPCPIGTIWHYEEDWYRHHHFWSDNWASWDLYFNDKNEYVGWRLVEPLGSETRAREHFYDGASQEIDVKRRTD